MTFGPDRQQKLRAYCEHRIEQLEAYLPGLEYFGVGDALNHYFRGLNAIIAEMDLKTNDSETKESNALWLHSSNDCWLFSKDIWAIVAGQEPPLPDDILAIRDYLAEIERKEREEQARLKKIADDLAWAEMQKRMAAKEAERQKRKREQLAEELGLDPEVLEKLKEGQKRVGAIQS